MLLAQRALADFAAVPIPGLRSALVELQANIVIESKAAKQDSPREHAMQFLAGAGVLARQARYGARELARLTSLRGYLEYVTRSERGRAGFSPPQR